MTTVFTPRQRQALEDQFKRCYKGVTDGKHMFNVGARTLVGTERFIELLVTDDPSFKQINRKTLWAHITKLARKAGHTARHRNGNGIAVLAEKELRRRLRTMPIQKLLKLVK